jgi:hypothetical protein
MGNSRVNDYEPAICVAVMGPITLLDWIAGSIPIIIGRP